MHRLVIIIIIVLIAFDLQGQTEKDFAYYNNETYQLYLNKNWNDLIILAKESIKDGHDFYYMRMRIGIAHYESGNYVAAIRHFKKAQSFDENNPVVKEYLYFAHFYMGRLMEAKKYYNYDGLKNRFFNSIYFEPGIKIANGNVSTGDIRYVFTGLNHELGPHINLFHGYQRLGADLETLIEVPGNGGGPRFYKYGYTIIQNEYYAAATILLTKGFFLTPAYHVQSVSTTGYSAINRVFSGQVSTYLGRFKIYGGYGYSEINDQNQWQITGGIVYYPLGNTKLSLNSEITNHQQDEKQSTITRNEISVKLFPKTWINGSLSYGKMVNYSELNGYTVYNQLDIMKSKWSLSINQYLGKHLLFINYTHENKEEFQSETPFVHHDFIMGINLIF